MLKFDCVIANPLELVLFDPAAAYRASERLQDERTGRTHDHSGRRDVLYKSIVLPSDLARDSPAWASERSSLWNLAEQAEPRRNARVAREFLVALPHELDLGQLRDLTHGFAQELSDRYRFGVDVAIHRARDFLCGLDQRGGAVRREIEDAFGRFLGDYECVTFD